MLELLLLLGLLEGVEPVGLLLSAGLLKELLPLLLPPLCLKLLPASFLSSLLLGDPGRLGSFTLTLQLVVDHLGESLEVEGEEHLEGVGLPVVGEGGELGLGVLLEMARQGEELLVEGGLLRPGETLPRSGVGEGLETKLLVLELLCDGLPLPGGEHQLVSVAEVDVAQVGDQGLPLLAREPWWRRGGGGGGRCRVVVVVVASGTAGTEAKVVKTGVPVVATGAAVVTSPELRGTSGVSVKPVMVSSTGSGALVVAMMAGAAVVMISAAVVISTGASVVVVVVSTWRGGAAYVEAANRRVP